MFLESEFKVSRRRFSTSILPRPSVTILHSLFATFAHAPSSSSCIPDEDNHCELPVSSLWGRRINQRDGCTQINITTMEGPSISPKLEGTRSPTPPRDEVGMTICTVPGFAVEEVADSTMSLMLNLYKKTFWLANSVKEGQIISGVEQVCKAAKGACRLRGDILGIVGLGRIGTAVAIRAKAFGLQVVFYDPFVPHGTDKSLGVTRMNTLRDLLNRADCVSLHCSLNEQNRLMFNDTTFSQMRFGAFFVNTARGGLVDDYALAKALRMGRVRAAAIDVHGNEPNHVLQGPLRDVPNLITTPHSAYWSEASFAEIREVTTTVAAQRHAAAAAAAAGPHTAPTQQRNPATPVPEEQQVDQEEEEDEEEEEEEEEDSS